ncbi:NB-ARC domain-containing protein [Lusitaniella coriacea]|uniref:WD40 repeat domain-containing protein n=1 Tax=Lusitaniella coriacea TaxID=1983105 RepID=UPI003CE81E71
MPSLKASQQGLTQIDRAIAERGWTKSSHCWLVEASKVLEPGGDWDEFGPYAYGCSLHTWERFLQGIAIRDRSFIVFCQALGLDPDEIAQSSKSLREDWGEAPDVPIFHGRERELETLEEWILEDRCRLIAIVGIAGIGKTRLVRGGIGKTDLSLQLTRRVRGEFECLIWRRLLNAPPPEAILSKSIEFISEGKETHLADTTDGLVTQLLRYLKQRRCLLILDNAESILQGGDRAGLYRPGYEGYGELFRRMGETEHQSCLLLTSREKPRDIEEMEGLFPARSLELRGVDKTAGQAIFCDIGCAYRTSFQGSQEDWENLISFYHGNPLALEVTARHILRRFDGNLAHFLEGGLKVFGKIRDLLDWHFERLSPQEREVAYWLAINREPVSISELQEDVLSPIAKKQIPETLDTLERQLPLEKIGVRVTLQPVLMEYLTNRFIEHICGELETGKLHLFNSHALIKASVKDYVRESQIRMILNPAISQLRSILDGEDSLGDHLLQILSSLKQAARPGYGGGNLLNLMRYGNLNLADWDFSELTIWQADLQGMNLHHVNFTDCEFAKTSFTQNFGGVHSISFSPDGDLLAVGDSNGDIRLFHLRDRQPLLCLRGHLKTWITSLAFSPDGKWLASGSLDGKVKLWDTHMGECTNTLEGHEKWVWSVAFDPNGQTIASSSDDNTVRLWNIQTGDCRVLEGHRGWVWAVAFHPKGHLLASGAYDNTIRLWNPQTGDCTQILRDRENAIWSVAFHPHDPTLASAGVDNTVKVWDLQTGNCLHALRGHTKEVRSIVFSADGKVIVSGSFDSTIKLWDSQTGELLKTLKGHSDEVRIVAIDSHRNLLASGDNTQLTKLWDLATGECVQTWQGYVNWMWAIAISADGRSIASGSLDRTVRLWDLETGKLVKTLFGHHNWVWSVAFSPDGRTLASSSDDATIRLWDVGSGQCRHVLRGHTNGGVWSVDFSPDGRAIASGGQDGTVRFWDAATGESLSCVAAHENWIWSVVFSPDGRTVASGSADGTIKLWDIKTGNCLACLEDTGHRVMSLAFSPNGQTIVAGEEYDRAVLWDIPTSRCIQRFQGHSDSIMGVAFSPNGQIVSSGSADETIRLWDVRTGNCLQVIKGHQAWVRAIAFAPDGRTLVSGSTDGTIRLWDVCTGQALKLLRPERPYEGTNLSGVNGLTAAQEASLMALGATQSERYSTTHKC